MFNNKIKALSALKGKKAAEITAEEMTALNAELATLDLEGIVVHQANADLFTQAQITGKVTAAVTEAVTAREGELATVHKTAVDALNATATQRDARITELEGEAGAINKPPKTGDNAHDGEDKKSKNDQVAEKMKAEAAAKAAKVARYKTSKK